MADEAELLDYDDEPNQQATSKNATGNSQSKTTNGKQAGAIRGSYVSIHASGFRDFLLKPELLRAIMDCGFEHPSEGQFFILISS